MQKPFPFFEGHEGADFYTTADIRSIWALFKLITPATPPCLDCLADMLLNVEAYGQADGRSMNNATLTKIIRSSKAFWHEG